jgi:hypothetical protein
MRMRCRVGKLALQRACVVPSSRDAHYKCPRCAKWCGCHSCWGGKWRVYCEDQRRCGFNLCLDSLAEVQALSGAGRSRPLEGK